MHRRNFIVGAVAVSAALVAGAAAADVAQSKALVDQAKTAGVVGEKSDGFLGFVRASGGDPALRVAVDEINAGRAQLYREAAARNGVTAAAAGAAAFEQVVKGRLKPGEYFQTPEGGWNRK